MKFRLAMPFTLFVLVPVLFIACQQNHRDYRGDVNIYESYTVAQPETILANYLERIVTL